MVGQRDAELGEQADCARCSSTMLREMCLVAPAGGGGVPSVSDAGRVLKHVGITVGGRSRFGGWHLRQGIEVRWMGVRLIRQSFLRHKPMPYEVASPRCRINIFQSRESYLRRDFDLFSGLDFVLTVVRISLQ